MSKPVDIKIAHINTQDQNKSSFDKDKIFEVFQMTINDSLKHFFKMQQGWVNRAYLNFNDFPDTEGGDLSSITRFRILLSFEVVNFVTDF